MRRKVLGRTGLEISELGFGASPLGNVFGGVSARECTRAVHAAIDLGINFFDVSPFYGLTLAEERLGVALAGKRDGVVLSTKCGRYGADDFDFSAARLHRSIDESLQRLKTGYVDLLLAHDIEFADLRQLVDESIPALRKIQAAGKARFIGISGLPLDALKQVAGETPVDVILSYCRYNLLVTDLDRLLTPFVTANGIGLINASPLHMGILTRQGPPPWHPAAPEVKEAGRRVVDLCEAQGWNVSDVALRFSASHPVAASTLAGMSTVAEVEQNVAALSKVPPPDLMAEIAAITEPVKDRIWKSGRCG